VGLPVPSPVDEDTSHGLRHGSEEVAATVPVLGLVHIADAQKPFVSAQRTSD